MASQVILRSLEEDEVESGEEHDEFRHKNMLRAISAIHGKSKVQEHRSETCQASEFHVAEDGKVRVHELVKALPQTDIQKNLKRQLNRAQKTAKTVDTPLHRPQREKIERETAYASTRAEISRWQPVVQRNQQADQLQFPLGEQTVTVVDTDKFVARFKPSSSLEEQVALLLQQSSNVVQPEKLLTAEEEKALMAMSLEEARERRTMLQKHRALISYKAAKLNRQSKIKSKTYHKILRKEKTKKEREELEKLKASDPEAFLEKLDEIDNSRIQERMTLKHKLKSRRLKKQAVFSKYDNNMRDAVQDMVRKHKELTQKQQIEPDSEDDTNNGPSSDVTMPEQFATNQDPTTAKNPWMSANIRLKKTSHGGPKEIMNQEAVHAQAESDDESRDGQLDNSESPSKKTKVSNVEPMRNQLKTGQNIETGSNSEEGSSDEESESESVGMEDIDEMSIETIFSKAEKQNDAKKIRAKKKENTETTTELAVEKTKKMKVSPQKPDAKTVKGNSKTTSGKKASEVTKEIDSDSDGEKDDGLGLTSTRRQNLEDFEGEWFDENAVTADGDVEPKERAATKKSEAAKSEPEARINPDEFVTVETQVETPGLKLVEDEEEEDNEDDSQRITIAQAFAEDDVVAEFAEEKQAMIDAEQPKDVDLTMPGWGSWGGKDIVPCKKFKKRNTIKAPKVKRKDSKLNHVIISQKRGHKRIAEHQIKQLPYPYTTAETYESYIRQPIGKTWNPETAYQQLTIPKVVTKSGTVINPISKEELTKFETKKRLEEPKKIVPKDKRGHKRKHVQKKRQMPKNADSQSVIKI